MINSGFCGDLYEGLFFVWGGQLIVSFCLFWLAVMASLLYQYHARRHTSIYLSYTIHSLLHRSAEEKAARLVHPLVEPHAEVHLDVTDRALMHGNDYFYAMILCALT